MISFANIKQIVNSCTSKVLTNVKLYNLNYLNENFLRELRSYKTVATKYKYLYEHNNIVVNDLSRAYQNYCDINTKLVQNAINKETNDVTELLTNQKNLIDKLEFSLFGRHVMPLSIYGYVKTKKILHKSMNYFCELFVVSVGIIVGTLGYHFCTQENYMKPNIKIYELIEGGEPIEKNYGNYQVVLDFENKEKKQKALKVKINFKNN